MEDKILVSFPNLGLDFNISNVAFKVFNMPIYWYGIIIAFAFLVCVLWAMRDSNKFGLVPETVIDLMLFAAPAAIIGARLYFVVFSWDTYKYNPIDILNLRKGGLAVIGGVLFAVIAGYFVARYKKIPVLKFFDFAVVYIPLGQAIGRWGNFFNQEAFGTNTSLPWGMTSSPVRAYLQNLANSGVNVNPDLPVHPTFLYESLWNFILFAFLMWIRRKKKFDGEVFCYYFIGYGIGRAVIEGLRTDSLMLGNLRVSQLLSIIFIIIFSIIVIYRRTKVKNNEEVEVGQSGYAAILKIMEEENTDSEIQSQEQEVKGVEPKAQSTEFETANKETESDETESSEAVNQEPEVSKEDQQDK